MGVSTIKLFVTGGGGGRIVCVLLLLRVNPGALRGRWIERLLLPRKHLQKKGDVVKWNVFVESWCILPKGQDRFLNTRRCVSGLRLALQLPEVGRFALALARY